MSYSEIKKVPKYILDEKRIFNTRVKLFQSHCAKLVKERDSIIAMREKLERDCAKHGLVFQFKM